MLEGRHTSLPSDDHHEAPLDRPASLPPRRRGAAAWQAVGGLRCGPRVPKSGQLNRWCRGSHYEARSGSAEEGVERAQLFWVRI